VGRQASTTAQVRQFREEVVRAAEHLFAERGYDGVSLRAIADALGVSAMTPYRYFRNKAEIFATVRGAAYARFADSQERALAAPAANAVERLGALGRAYFAFAIADPDGYRLMFELAQPDPDSYPALREVEGRAWAPLRRAIGDAIAAGVLAGDPDSVANVFWAGVHGLVSLWLARKLVHARDLDALVEPMLLTLFRGNQRPAEDSA
jgi:AcrR family transcriptional regulator